MNQELSLASDFALQSYFGDTTMHESRHKKWKDVQNESTDERYHEL